MKVIAVYHNKGGVGKTTTVTSLGAALALQGFRVLLVDLDSQANTTFATGLLKFVFEEEDDIKDSNIYHVIAEKNRFSIKDVARQASYCSVPIDVIPSHINLTLQEKELSEKAFSKTRLLDKIAHVRQDYDFVLLDCPPSRDLYSQIALITADYLLIPSDLKPFANTGLKNVKNFVEEINEFRNVILKPDLFILGILPSKILPNPAYIKGTLPRLEESVRKRYELPILSTRIYDRVDLSYCFNQEQDFGDMRIPDPRCIFDYKPDSKAAEEFMALSREILSLVNLGGR